MKTLIGLLALLLCSGVLAVEETDVEEESLPIEQIVPPGDLGVTGDTSSESITSDDLSQASTAATVCPTKVVFGKPTLLPMVPNCGYGGSQCPEKSGWRHTGIDYAGAGEALAVADGTVVWVEFMGSDDHGIGANVIVEHILPGPRCSALYSSYLNILETVHLGQTVVKGDVLGIILDTLHFELKADAVTGNPWGIGRQDGSCENRPWHAQANTCRYFTKGWPTNLGYLNPGLYLNISQYPSSTSKLILEIMVMTQTGITIGAPALAFNLPDQEGNPVSLQDLQGRWVVLYFYPRDDTPGCTTEACDFTAGLEEFEALNATVLGCSPDGAASHRQFIAKHDLKITLLSDEDHAVMDRYGAWGEKNRYGKISQGVLRSTVLIDPEGKVAHHWKNVKAAGHAGQVRKKLEELQVK